MLSELVLYAKIKESFVYKVSGRIKDDEEIANVAGKYGIEVVKRPGELADDRTTLDPVIYHAINEMEKRCHKTYDIVITMQATSPTLQSSTLNAAVKQFVDNNIDTMISAVNSVHLIDIDNELDWILCEHILKKKKVVIRADGEKSIGMGHIYRSITLVFMLIGHDVTIVTNKNCQLGVKK